MIDAPVLWSCTVPGKCVTKGNSGRIMKRGKRRFFAPSAQSVDAQGTAADFMRPLAPPSPLEGPLRVDVVFVRALPQKTTHQPGDWCAVKVDRGNLLKLAEDAMEDAGIFRDDCQIVTGNVSKVWGRVAETRIVIRRA